MADQISANGDIEIGELGIGEPDTANATVITAGLGADFDVAVDTDDTDHSHDDEFAMDITQSAWADVAEDGSIVGDIVTTVVDEESGVTLIDEVVAVVAPDGTTVADETVSVIDADGSFGVLAEGIDVVDDETPKAL